MLYAALMNVFPLAMAVMGFGAIPSGNRKKY